MAVNFKSTVLLANGSALPLFSCLRSQWLLKTLAFALLSQFAINSSAQSNESFATAATSNVLIDSVISEEQQFNVYEQDSLEPLIGLGLLMQEQGDHTRAVNFLKQARQVSRIQNGLYDETQIAILEAIIESEMQLRNYEDVDAHYNHMEYLYTKLYDLDDQRLDNGLQKISGWLSYALSINPVGNRVEQLRRANRIYKLRLEIAERTLASNHPRFNYLLENIAICEKQLYQFLDNDGSGLRQQNRRRSYSSLARAN